MDNVVKLASEFVTKLLNENLPSEYKYHNLVHAREVFAAVTDLGKNSNLLDEELEIIQIAAWFHDTGFVKDHLDHEYNGVKILKEFLGNFSYPEGKINRISDIIVMTEIGSTPTNLSERIIRDADILHVGKEEFYSKSLTLKSEWEIIDHKKFTDIEWLQASLAFIKRTLFFTDYAKSKYEAGRQKNIFRLKEMIEKLNPS